MTVLVTIDSLVTCRGAGMTQFGGNFRIRHTGPLGLEQPFNVELETRQDLLVATLHCSLAGLARASHTSPISADLSTVQPSYSPSGVLPFLALDHVKMPRDGVRTIGLASPWQCIDSSRIEPEIHGSGQDFDAAHLPRWVGRQPPSARTG
ncbi:hypothetical protein BO78DRAFT_151805 [Aspergillus sclerotiicarbonarius CBS 121057]|uniref:Uncharacterized protein n=1 Tax=Aspergillus sclerotiicarbonarius (strain CBS 121057 / IBT 28362) TaxID=1448318 RepID=A0A319EF78_ASPSB|nr:hypothetical protein BO78DRAFT_151805 [Aspergillus sclerotiicarbonarius CBS 121057]